MVIFPACTVVILGLDRASWSGSLVSSPYRRRQGHMGFNQAATLLVKLHPRFPLGDSSVQPIHPTGPLLILGAPTTWGANHHTHTGTAYIHSLASAPPPFGVEARGGLDPQPASLSSALVRQFLGGSILARGSHLLPKWLVALIS